MTSDNIVTFKEGISIPFVLLCFFTISNFFSPLYYLGENYARLPFYLSVISAISYVLYAIAMKKKMLYLNSSVILVLILWMFAIFSTYVQTVNAERSLTHFENLSKSFLLFLLIANIITNKKELKYYLTLLIFCTFGLAYQLVNNPIWDRGRATIQGSNFGGDPNIITLVFVFILPTTIAFFFISKKKIIKIALLYFVFTMLLGIVEAQSRGGFLSLLVMAGYSIFQFKGTKQRITAAIIIIMAGSLFFARYAPPRYIYRMQEIVNPESDPTGSAQARSEAMSLAYNYTIKHPISEYGLGNHSYYIADIYGISSFEADIFRGSFLVHNAFLQIGADMGWIPLLIFLLYLLSLFYILGKIAKNTYDSDQAGDKELHYISKSLRTSLTALIVCTFFLASAYQPFFYYAGGCCVAAYKISTWNNSYHNA
jgi:hypothetical protein